MDLTDIQLQNLLTFLNRCPITGFSEIKVMNELMSILTKDHNIQE